MPGFPSISAAHEYERERQRRNPPTRPLSGGRASERIVVPIGWALLQASDDPALSIVVELGDSAPRVTQGYGGWDSVERARRVALTSWRGFEPVAIELELFIDNLAEGKSIEPVLDILEALAGRGRRSTGGEPPLLRVDTSGVMPHDLTASPDVRWVITDLDWDDEDTIVNHAGNRIRAGVTVALLQHVRDTRLEDRALLARRQAQAKQGAKRTYTAKTGETLVTIARDKLGDPGRWDELAKLNNIRDPRGIKSGARIKLP